MPILTEDARSLLQRRVGTAIAKTRDDASWAWKAIKIDVVKRGVSGGSIEKTLLREKVQSGFKELATRLQADAVEVIEAAGLSVTAEVIPEVIAAMAPLLDNMERGMDSEFGGIRGFGDRLKAQLTRGLDDLAMLNKLRSDADSSRRQTEPSVKPVPTSAPRQPALQDSAAPVVRRRFRVSLSFAGEHRGYVKEVAEILVGALGTKSVLYDKYFEAEFARSGLDVYLPDLYRKESDLIVVFISRQYDSKPWCGLEWRSIRQLIAEKRHSQLMFLRFDNSEVEGILPGDGYAHIVEGDAERTSLEIAELILERLRVEADVRASSTRGPDGQ
jgi:hypothetical protein